MTIDITMPKMGESVTEGTIIKWHKQPGDAVERDETIAEISTDKVDTELPAPEAGTLAEILVAENETAEVGTVLAKLETDASGAATSREESGDQSEAQSEDGHDEEPDAPDEEGDAIDVPMPKMGESITEGTVVKWHKQPGDKIEREETICEISTDKVDTEVPSPADGYLAEILVAENETAEVGATLCRLSSSADAAKSATKQAAEKPKADKPKADEPKAAAPQKPDASESSKFFSPLVLNIAGEHGVSIAELERLEGTGINGRVTKNDVLRYIESGKQQAEHAAPPPSSAPKQAPEPTATFDGGVERIPMDNIRRKVMEHMTNSRDTSVHVTTMVEVDMSKVYDFIKLNKNRYLDEQGVKLTYTGFIAEAAVKALKRHPLVNSTIEGTNILRKKYVNLGVAVAMEPNGLIVPNVKRADEKNFVGLSRSIADLAERARNRRLAPDEIADGTFTITNYGVFGALFGTPIINQPEVAILGAGAVQKRPVAAEHEGQDVIAVKPMMYLALAHDHRLIDGMLGSLFLATVKEELENFSA